MKAIITGHSRGLGAAVAGNLLARNISVLGLSRNSRPDLQEQFGEMFTQMELDLSDSAAVLRWLAEGHVKRFVARAHVILLINNAGTVQPVGPLNTQDAAAIAHTVALNLTTPMLFSSAIAAMPGKKRVLHISSGAGRTPYPGWSVYCGTKAALDQHARAAALDGASDLRICSLAPGVIDTEMQDEIRATPLERFPLRERFDALKQSGNLSDAKATAQRLVDFLLSDKFGREPVADLRNSV